MNLKIFATIMLLVGSLLACGDDDDNSIAASSTLTYSDDFNRATLGTIWLTGYTISGGVYPSITNNMACSDVQGATLYNQNVIGSTYTVSFTFTSSDASGFEVWAVADSDDNLDNGLFMAGLNGSGPNLSIQSSSTTDGGNLSLTVDTTYTVEAVFDNAGGTVTLTLKQGSTTVDTLSASDEGTGFNYFGFIVGRNSDSNLSCIDDFSIVAN